MIHAKRDSNMLSFLYKPLCVVIVVFGLFGIIWLRSSIVKFTYELHNLEEKRLQAHKETRMLIAKRAELMSLEQIEASFKGKTGRVYAKSGYVFPQRVRVVQVKRGQRSELFNASLKLRDKNR